MTKGFEMTTNLLLMVAVVVLVVFIMFAILSGLIPGIGPSSNSVWYGVVDAILGKGQPLVS